jgi:SPP1 family predicted phage head-tail adaptor
MRAGELRFRLEIQEAIEVKNSVGERVKTFATRGSVRGSIAPMRGDERFNAQQVKAVTDTKITIRGNAAPYLTPKMRMTHTDGKTGAVRIFDIESIINVNSRGIMTEIEAKELT